jgi:serine/threonine protein kinase
MWALGCIVFKMITGKAAFPGLSEMQVFPLIKAGTPDWPNGDDAINEDCRSFIEGCFKLDSVERFGHPDSKNDINTITKHPFFNGIDFGGDLTQLNLKSLLL